MQNFKGRKTLLEYKFRQEVQNPTKGVMRVQFCCIFGHMLTVQWSIRRKIYPTVQEETFWPQAANEQYYRGLGHQYGGPRVCGYSNISMQIIEKVNQGDHSQLAKREVYWQNEIRCLVQNGVGGHCYRKEK